METIELSIATLPGRAEALDLGNAVNPLNGVEHVAIDSEAGRVKVTYDPAFASPETISNAVTRSGYPLKSKG